MGVVGHTFQLAVSEFFEFGFGFRLMAFEFLVFQVIPHLLVRIPVGQDVGTAGRDSPSGAADNAEELPPFRQSADVAICCLLCTRNGLPRMRSFISWTKCYIITAIATW